MKKPRREGHCRCRSSRRHRGRWAAEVECCDPCREMPGLHLFSRGYPPDGCGECSLQVGRAASVPAADARARIVRSIFRLMTKPIGSISRGPKKRRLTSPGPQELQPPLDQPGAPSLVAKKMKRPDGGVAGAGVAGMEDQACIRFDRRDSQRGAFGCSRTSSPVSRFW